MKEIIMNDKTKHQQDKEIDRNSADSFPASDPVSPFVPAVPVDDDLKTPAVEQKDPPPSQKSKK